MSSPPEHERRQDHRIRHPKAEQPTFLHEGKSYAVIDYSAQSLRYAAPGETLPTPHTRISGVLRFRHGAEVNIEAIVLRVNNDEVVLRLDKREISAESERRQDHRIRYPKAERPLFLYEAKSFPVIDVSARGVRYLGSGSPLPMPYTAMNGILRFRRGAQVNIEAMVLRVHNEEVVLHLLKREIPFAVLLDEQRYLHQHYPVWS